MRESGKECWALFYKHETGAGGRASLDDRGSKANAFQVVLREMRSQKPSRTLWGPANRYS